MSEVIETSTHTWNPDAGRWKRHKVIEYDADGMTTADKAAIQAFKERHLCYLFPRWFELADQYEYWSGVYLSVADADSVWVTWLRRKLDGYQRDMGRLDWKINRLVDRMNGKPIPKGHVTPDMIAKADTYPIESILAAHGHEPVRGNMYLCIFHEEKTASMSVYNNRVKCFGECGKSTGAIGVYRQCNPSKSFPAAVRTLCGGG